MDKLDKLPKKSTRDGFGEGLLELGQKNSRVVVLSADLSESTRSIWFKEKFPDRFIEVGVAEQNLIDVAAGLAQEGFIPFATSFAEFSPGRNWEQIKISVCYNNVPVKIASTHAGISVGADGASHQMLEDIAMLRALPNLTIISPVDAIEAKKATIAAASWHGPVYLRFGRINLPAITRESDRFKIGQGQMLRAGRDLTIFAHGLMVNYAFEAAKKLSNAVSCEVINISTIKPLDEKLILKSVKKTGQAIVAEEARKSGGLFSAITELLAENYPCPIYPISIGDTFTESGDPTQLIEKYKISTNDIIKTINNLLTNHYDQNSY